MWTMTAFEYPVDANEAPAVANALYSNPAKDKVLVFDTPFAPGPQKPRVFADGLAIPLGILPYKNGCYAQHGPDIVFLSDTDGDGKADKREVILTGFGVQDSHLFPHQFTRAPGGWIWFAQGAFNYSKVRRANEPPEKAVKFDMTRMAKFRPDGSDFTITSQGPCNIWGLVINGEGEAFIQEANDFGYPVIPFHEYANYPGCSDALWKSYAPEFPGTAPDFKMGGTGLSGLALSDKAAVNGDQLMVNGQAAAPSTDHQSPFTPGKQVTHTYPEPYADVMYVANPITRKIQAIKMHREGPRWRMQLLGDFIQSSDEMFRPVAIKFGPDGCLYIVDWYNKIISHNEVPRAHPDRDKTRGRIWRVKHKDQTPFPVPDMTKLSGDELIAKLGGPSLAQSHLAWQAIGDRGMKELTEKLGSVVEGGKFNDGARIQALWALEALGGSIPDQKMIEAMWSLPNRNLRREGVSAAASPRRHSFDAHGAGWDQTARLLRTLTDDPDPHVRATAINGAGAGLQEVSEPPHPPEEQSLIQTLLLFAREPLAEPVAPSTRNGKPSKVREAYDREFERYLVRMFLEKHPEALAKFLDSDDAKPLPVEARLLASLALEPKASAARVAKLLPQLTRPPGQEEVLRLAQFPEEPGVGEALKAVLANAATRDAALEALLATRTRLDAKKLTPLLNEAAVQLISGTDAKAQDLGLKLAAGFQLAALEPQLVATVQQNAGKTSVLPALRALREMGSGQAELFAKLAKTSPDAVIRDEALHALAASKSENAGKLVLELWPDLTPTHRRAALERLASTRSGARSIVAAVRSGALPKSELDGASVEKMAAVLGDDADFLALMQELDAIFRPVLALDGSDNAFTDPDLTLDGPFTVETWVKLDPGINNEDGLLGARDQLDINFYDAKLRVWIGGGMNDAIVAKRPISPDVWTHIAVTRDAKGAFKLYLDGVLDNAESKLAPQKFEHVRIAWTGTPKGTAGALSEFRVWNRERNADEIRATIDRALDVLPKPDSLVFRAAGAGPWGKLASGAKITKTSDFPPLLTADEATQIDAKFAKYRALAAHPGDVAKGQALSAICTACHLIGPQGGNIGPNLSGAGAMGIEALLHNIITPNAAMENGYRIFRVEQKNGDLVDALFVSEDKDAVVVRMPGAQDRRIPRAEIRAAKYLRRSLMPEGLLDALPPESVSDLFAYLKTLK